MKNCRICPPKPPSAALKALLPALIQCRWRCLFGAHGRWGVSVCGLFSSGDSLSEPTRRLEEERKARINDGMASIDTTFAPFNADYYKGYETAYRDQAMPDINRQYRDATQQTRYGLARTGNLDSSAAAKAYGDLRERSNQAQLKVADDARSAASGQRQSLEGARTALTQQLSATENPSAAAMSAANQAAVLSRPPTYNPITDIFANATGHFANNEVERREGREGWGFDLFGPYPRGNRSSVTQIG